jgi:hypothetical protein
MKLVNHKILLFFALGFLLCACQSTITSDKVEQRIIFPSYSAQYDEAAQTLTATVTFQTDNESGEYIKLSSDSYVFFNQDAMERKSDKERPCYYFFEKTGVTSCPESVMFNYNNDEGRIFGNQLSIKPIQISEVSLSRNQDNLVKYKGSPLTEDETISLVMCKDEHQYEISPEVAENNMLVISGNMLQELKAGTYDAHLQRTSYSTSVKAMDRGGNAVTTYLSKIYKITIQ